MPPLRGLLLGVGEATTGRANVADGADGGGSVNLAFRPESGFLLPYVAAAGTLPGLSDEFMGHLAAALRERRRSVGRVLTTRGALSSLDISLFPLVAYCERACSKQR